MGRGVRLFVTAALFGFWASGAGAEGTQTAVPPKTTADLVAVCSPQGDASQAGAATAYCYGFIEGAVEVVMSYSAAGPKSRQPFCLPSPAPQLSQAVSDFVAWANSDAALLQKPAIVGLASYLINHFPCAKSDRSARKGAH